MTDVRAAASTVPCVACGTANEASAKFCRECGTRLAATCPACGSTIAPGQRFCSECGTALSDTGTPRGPLAERRLCSVLFCDLVGFTSISETRDPETVRELLTHYFDEARIVIERYGGTIEKFIGDAVMAVWGAPIATEDDAERAVRAALELLDTVVGLREATGVPDLAARAGIVTGEVAVTIGAVGQGMVAGDPVNTAARLQAAADPGQVVVDDTTAHLVRAAIELADVGTIEVRGRTRRQQAWLAVRVLAGVRGEQRSDGLEAPLIGRDLEMRLIRDLLHATTSRRASRLVLVTGSAGVGKSRLGWEFEKYVDGIATEVWWHRGRCLSYGNGIAYWALIEMVRQRLGIAETDPPDVALQLLLEGLDRHVPDEEERSFVGIRLGRLLGLPHPEDDGRSLGRNELFAGWRTWLVRLADEHPVVWVIEDLHRADTALLDFLDHLLDWTRTAPILVLALGRTDLDRTHPGWSSGRHRQQIALEPLEDLAGHDLLDSLVPGIPRAAADLIVRSATGNPLFLIETVRSLIDRGMVTPRDGRHRMVGEVGMLTVPTSLRSLLAARLDLLPSSLRHLVSCAAVLGSTFSPQALAELLEAPDGEVEPALAELVARELLTVSADRLSPERGGYAFTNDLLRLVAIETLSRHEQRAQHLRVAEVLRSSSPDAAEQQPTDLIAQHLLDAADAVPEAHDMPSIVAEAADLLVVAAERDARLGALRRAARNLAAAASRVSDPRRRTELLSRAAELAHEGGDPDITIELGELAVSILTGLGETRRAASVDATVSFAIAAKGDVGTAVPRLERALEVLRIEPDADTVRCLRHLAEIVILRGGDGREPIERAMSLGEQLSVGFGQMARNFRVLALMHSFAHERARAEAAQLESIRLGLLVEDWESVAGSWSNLAADEVEFDPASSIPYARSAIEFARRGGVRPVLANGLENLTQALIATGRWDEARTALREPDIASDLDDLVGLQFARGRMAGLMGDVAGLERARRRLRDHRLEEVEQLCFSARLDLLLAEQTDDPAHILAAAETVLAFRDRVGINLSAVRDAWVLASRSAHAIAPDREGALLEMLSPTPPVELSPMLHAERRLAEARRGDGDIAAAIAAQRLDSPPHLLAEGLLDWAEMLLADGDRDAAADRVEEAGAIAQRLGAAHASRRASRLAAAVAATDRTPR